MLTKLATASAMSAPVDTGSGPSGGLSDRATAVLLVGVGITALVVGFWIVSWIAQRSRPARTSGVYGPIKWFFLFASGAKLEILRECPEEEGKYVGLGSAVVITSTMGALSTTLSLSIALNTSWYKVAPVGLLYGTIIFLLDRFLVSQSLNPYRFTPTSVPGVWNPTLAEAQYLEKRRGRAGSIDWGKPVRVVTTFIAAIPRLLIAILIGFLISEPLLLVIFDQEVDQRISGMQAELSERAQSEAEAPYIVLIQQAEAEVAGVGGDSSQDLAVAQDALASLDAQISTASTNVSQLEGELETLQQQLQAEIRGDVLCEGEACTSGEPGDGPNARAFREQIAAKNLAIDGARTERDNLTAQRPAADAEVQRLQAAVLSEQGQSDAREAAAQAKVDQLRAERDVAVANARAEALDTDGLLLRIQALESLTDNDDPFATTQSSERPSGWLGLTTLGTAVWLLRLWILMIDCMPIFFKISLSLRNRRPYDALLAAREEASTAVALARVDAAYSSLGQEFWDRVAERDLHRRHLWRKITARVRRGDAAPSVPTAMNSQVATTPSAGPPTAEPDWYAAAMEDDESAWMDNGHRTADVAASTDGSQAHLISAEKATDGLAGEPDHSTAS